MIECIKCIVIVAHQPLAILFYRCSLDLSSFFAALSPRSLGRSSPNFVACSMVTQIYKIRSEIWVALPPKFVGQKASNFRCDFR